MRVLAAVVGAVAIAVLLALIWCATVPRNGSNTGPTVDAAVATTAAQQQVPVARSLDCVVIDAETRALMPTATLSYRFSTGQTFGARQEAQASRGVATLPIGDDVRKAWIDVRGPDTATSTYMLDARPGATAKLRVWRLCTVTVRAIDLGSGGPLAGVEVGLRRQQDPDAADEGVLQGVLFATTVELGDATVRVAAGAYSAWCEGPLLERAEATAVIASERANELMLRPRAVPSPLGGTVVEGWSGAPIPAARIAITGVAEVLTSDAQGRFALSNAIAPASGMLTSVIATPPPECSDLASQTVNAAWGDAAVVVRMGRRAQFVEVRGDARAPRLSWKKDSAAGDADGGKAWHELTDVGGGTFRLPESEAPFANHWLRLVQGDEGPRYARLPDLPYTDTATGRVHRWEVSTRSELVVDVVDQADRPLEGVQVEALFAHGEEAAVRISEPVDDYDPTIEHPLFSKRSMRIASARTDAHGQARLQVLRMPRLVLRAVSAGHRTEIVEVTEAATVRVCLHACGGARGVLVPYESGTLHLVPAARAAAQPSIVTRGTTAQVQKDGRFELAGYDLGRYRLYLVGRREIGRSITGIQWQWWWRDLGEIEIADPVGAPLRIPVPAADLHVVHVEADGLREGEQLVLRHDASGMREEARVGRDGCGEVLLQPGTWSVARVCAVGWTQRIDIARDPVVVTGRSGGVQHVRLAFDHRAGRVRMMTAQGPAVRTHFTLAGWGGDPWRTNWVSDDDGWLTFEHLPASASRWRWSQRTRRAERRSGGSNRLCSAAKSSLASRSTRRLDPTLHPDAQFAATRGTCDATSLRGFLSGATTA